MTYVTSPNMFFLLAVLVSLVSSGAANFGFFEQMFGSGGNSDHEQQQQQQRTNPSDASLYRNQWDSAVCNRYLCPDTLACVHFSHHCPCPWDEHEDKFELQDGHRICVSKGGFKPGEAASSLARRHAKLSSRARDCCNGTYMIVAETTT